MNIIKIQSHKTLLNLLVLIGLMFSLYSLPVQASTLPQAESIQIEDAYIRQAPPGAHATASFMVLQNPSEHDITLTSVESNLANVIELHAHTHKDGMMKMYQVKEIKVPAKGSVSLQPGGLHIMLIEPTDALKNAETGTIKLVFSDGSSKKITLPIRSMMHKMHKKH